MRKELANPSVVLVCLVAIGLAWALPSGADFDLNTAVGIWHMDEGEGEVAADSSPQGNDGELWRGPVWVDGKFGKGLSFDGQSFVWIRNATGLPEGTSPRTVMCHFKWERINPWVDIVQWENDAEMLVSLGPNSWRKRVSMGIFLEGDPGLGVSTFDDRQYAEWEADTEWHHAAIVYPEDATTSDQWLIYFDGVHQAETFMDADVNAIDSSGGLVNLASMSGKILNFFTGTLDEAAVFPFAMAAEDIASVAQRGLVRGQQLDVGPTGRLTTSWGALKQR